jgi:HEAT repeat protein
MNQKRFSSIPFFALVLVFIALQGLSAQEPILNSYERNFIRANLSTKAGILKDAATDERAPEFIGQLYEFAMNFALANAEILREDPDMIALTGLACRGAGEAGYKNSVDTLWKVFVSFRDSFTRSDALGALAKLGKGNKEIVGHLNMYLANQNSLYRSGMRIDYPTVSACIAALSSLGDSASFPVLFSAMSTGYPDSISREAAGALSHLQGDYKQFLIDVIRNIPAGDKLAALNAGLNDENFGAAEKGLLAEAALEISLAPAASGAENDNTLSELRYSAIQVLSDLEWTRANPLAIKHFYRVQTDYQNGRAARERFLEAITCLGSMGSPDAAQALAIQLGFFNSQTERNGIFDEEITLAVIHALGKLGDKAAFDYLLYISYLPYPEQIQVAAREALDHLKW